MAAESNGNGVGNGNGFEKTPFQSKKFLVYLISSVTWKVIIVMMLFVYEMALLPAIIIMTAMIVCGFIEAYAIGGQAAIDRYVRVAQIQAGMMGGAGELKDKVTDLIPSIGDESEDEESSEDE